MSELRRAARALRRRSAFAALVILIFVLGAPERTRGEDWPRLLGPHGDGRSTETGLALAWGSEGPPLLWYTGVGEGFAAPVIADGRVFVFDRSGDEARLRALDAETGDPLWEQRYPTDYEDYYGFSPGPRAPAVVDADRVYAFGVEGRLRCHRVDDGTLLWELDTSERFGVVKNFFGVGSSPIVEGDLLIAQIGGSPPGSPRIHSGEVRGNGSGIVAFDKLTGEVRWQASNELSSYSSPVVVSIEGERRGLSFMRGGLVGFDPQTGSVQFEFPWRSRKLESVNASNPVVVGDRVLIAESYGRGGVLLQLRDGAPQIVWQDPRRDPSLSLHWMTPVVVDGTVYASSGSGAGDAQLRAVSLETGETLWSEPGLGRSTLLLADGHLIVLTEYGRLLVLRPSPRRFDVVADATPELPGQPGTTLLDRPAWAPPALANGLLYVRGKSRVACLDLRAP